MPSINPEIFLNSGSFIVAILTLIVAILTLKTAERINKKITIQKFIFEKQIDTIFKLINELQDLRFVIMDLNNNSIVLSYFSIEDQIKNDVFQNLKDEPLLISTQFFNNFPPIKYKENPFTPPEIVGKILPLLFTPMGAVNTVHYPNHIRISCGKEDINSVFKSNNTNFNTLGEFCDKLIKLKIEIKKWTQGHMNV